MKKTAYNEDYLRHAKSRIGNMFDYADYGLNENIDDFMEKFIKSGIAEMFGEGHPKYVLGTSGYELAAEVEYETTGKKIDINPIISDYKSPIYWAGWSLAYYQWVSGMSFAQIQKAVPISDIVEMYHPLHEAGLDKFVDVMDGRIAQGQI